MSDEYKIKLSELNKTLKKVFRLGYGSTIHLTINGESYEIVNDSAKNKEKKRLKA